MPSDTPLNIKDPEVYQLARQLANLTGQTLTNTVRTALRERLSRHPQSESRPALGRETPGHLQPMRSSARDRPTF